MEQRTEWVREAGPQPDAQAGSVMVGTAPRAQRGSGAYLDHLGEVARICQLQHDVQLIVLDERVQVLDDIWMI